MGVRWVELLRKDVLTGVKITMGEPFHFQALHYTEDELDNKRHPYELEKCPETFLRLDWKHIGLGSGSVGPGPREPYVVTVPKGEEGRYKFKMDIVQV